MMKSILRLLPVAATCLAIHTATYAQFSPGNIVVYQVGNGTVISGATGAPVILKEYNPLTVNQASPVSTVNIPATGAGQRLVNSFSATSEGFLSLSSDSSRLVFAGYDTSVGVGSLTGTTSAGVPRVVDTIGIAGIPGRVALTTTAFSGQSIRAATANAGNNYWATGGSSAVVYMGTQSTGGTVTTTPTNLRVIHALNGNLYFTTGSGTVGLWKLKKQSINTAKPDTPVVLIATANGASPSPYGFSINASETVAYIADDRSSTTLGGIYRWTLNTTTGVWTATDSLKPGTGAAGGARGIAVNWSGTYPVVYATTTDNRLIRWVDSNNLSHIYTVLATAPANTVFRSVAFTPKAVSCPSKPVVSYTPGGSLSFCSADTVTLRTSRIPGASYLWTLNGVAIPGAATTDTFLRVNSAGWYNLMINRNVRCFDTAVGSSILIGARPIARIGFKSNDSVCHGDTMRLYGGGAGTVQFYWSNWLPVPTTDTTFLYLSNNPGSLPLSLDFYAVVFNPATPGCRDTATVKATVMPLPKPAVVNNAGILTAPNGYTNYLWYYNGNPILGSNTTQLSPGFNGRYYVVVTDSFGCTGGSAEYNITNVGVDQHQTIHYRLSPNPVRDMLYIDAPVALQIRVADLQGRTLVFEKASRQLSLKQLASGLYTVSVYDQNNMLLGTQLLHKAD